MIEPPAGEPFVLAFVASWCAQCGQSLAMLQSLHESTGVEVILVDTHDSGTAIGWLADANIALPIANDAAAMVADSYRVSVGLPSTYFVDGEKRLQAYEFGSLAPGTDASDKLSQAMASIGLTYTDTATPTVSPPQQTPQYG